jgi:hypothetical protein
MRPCNWCFRCGWRRLWACVAAKLEDNHERRTVMANAKANAARAQKRI